MNQFAIVALINRHLTWLLVLKMKHVLHFLKNLFLLHATRFMFIMLKGPLCMRLLIKGRIYCLSIKLVLHLFHLFIFKTNKIFFFRSLSLLVRDCWPLTYGHLYQRNASISCTAVTTFIAMIILFSLN